MEEEMMEPGEAFMQLLADLQEKYSIEEEDMNVLVDAFNECMGMPAEEEIPEEVPVEEPVEDEEEV